jgi:pSer/pThr/pTyr-binding forkhead associated (FHA) protein/S1-C subfamily serine protease
MKLLKIGRDQSCDIVLHSDKVSSLHAELTMLNNGDILLEDKGSHNGTFIMNQPIQPNKPVNVRRGDAIRFADVELQWSQVPMPEDNSAFQGIYGIGSHFNNDIQLSGATVSRYHATVKHGRDGKMYIVDHSKNGTTVDGVKIQPNKLVRIKKNSVVTCGGVPVDLSTLPWSNSLGKTLGLIAAAIVVLVGIGFGIYALVNKGSDFDDTAIYNRYNHSVVMLKGIYHYEVKIDGLDLDELNEKVLRPNGGNLPTKVMPLGNSFQDVSDFTDKQLISLIDEIYSDRGLYSGTGFFISSDGKVLTNLHVVKPWLDGNDLAALQNIISRRFASYVEGLKVISLQKYAQLSAYVSQVKVVGVLDYIALVPQGEIFDPDNIRRCKVLTAGEDLNEDVALIQVVSAGGLPTNCTYVNVKDSMSVADEDLTVGTTVYSVGFPLGHQMQQKDENLKAVCVSGTINQEATEYNFMLNLTSANGASGSPIFNKHGQLIGILHAGFDKRDYTEAVKAKYIKKLLDSPHTK